MTASPDDNLTFEQALAALEEIVRELEDGQIGLEEALGRYERGIHLLKRCYRQLNEAEQKLQLLTGMDLEGRPLLQPFEPSPLRTEIKQDNTTGRGKERPDKLAEPPS